MLRNLIRAWWLLGWLTVMAAFAPAAHAAHPTAPDRPLFGIYSPDIDAHGVATIGVMQRSLRRRVDVVNVFGDWQDQDPAPKRQLIEAIQRSGRIPMLTWEPWTAPPLGLPGTVAQPEYRLERIRSGAFDEHVLRWAQALASLPAPVYLRPMHEMNGDWYPWGGTVNANRPADYRAAWRHLHDLFTQAGAENVRLVWSPLAEDVPNRPGNRMEAYYPGARYVDVLGVSGFNWGARHPDYGGFRSFERIFRDAYLRLSRLGRQPIWITETASAAEGGSKPRWIRQMFVTIRRWSRIRAVNWFNARVGDDDWRATVPASSSRAFAVPRSS
jgi:beta-mannanase